MSMPASARTSSTSTGSVKACQQQVAQLPPAWGWGTAATISYPRSRATARSTTMARFRCSQHWAASATPCACKTGRTPSSTACAASMLDCLPMRPPVISLLEQPTTNRSPVSRCTASSSSVAACRACAVICAVSINVTSYSYYTQLVKSGGYNTKPRQKAGLCA